MRFALFLPIAGFLVFTACKSSGGSVPSSTGAPTASTGLMQANQPIKGDGPVGIIPSDADIEAMRAAFFSRPAENEEVFRLFITSEGYTRKQMAFPDNISVKEDPTGDQGIADEFRKFDMVNSLQEGQIRVELYPTTGKFYRVRQSKPSIMKETDKMMSDDITRWQFQFAKNEIIPKDFRVSYQVLLRKKITREQALKILSEQNKKKK